MTFHHHYLYIQVRFKSTSRPNTNNADANTTPCFNDATNYVINKHITISKQSHEIIVLFNLVRWNHSQLQQQKYLLKHSL